MSREAALEAGEWANWKQGVERGDSLITLHKMAPHRALSVEPDGWVHQEGLHATAALCLHEQGYGFTRADVELLRKAHEQEKSSNHHWTLYTDLADRIEALLRPEEG